MLGALAIALSIMVLFIFPFGTGDDLGAAAHRAQADPLDIEAQAKRRLADEYDAAQVRGEVAAQGKPSRTEGLATTADIGLIHKNVHEARLIRDAEVAEPGIVRRTLDEQLAAGREPRRASIKRGAPSQRPNGGGFRLCDG